MAYARLFKQRRRERTLPNVIALLVYNGSARWRGPRRFTELTRPPPSLRRYSLDFEVVLLDVGAVPNAQLSKHRTLRAGLLAFKASTVAAEHSRPSFAPSSQPSGTTRRPSRRFSATLAESPVKTAFPWWKRR